MGGAKNCPETPRQKMIGMMYLVLTAMLALNVSTDVLKGFKTVDDSVHSSIAAMEESNAMQMRSFEAAYQQNPAKCEEWYQKAQVLSQQSDSIFDYIQNFKYNLAVLVDGEEADKKARDIKNSSDVDMAAAYAIVQGNGEILRNKIGEYRDFLIQLSDSTKTTELELILATPEGKTADGLTISWESSLFEHMPIGATMALLTTIQNDIRSAQGEMIQYLRDQVDAGDFRANKLEAYVIPESRNVMRGDKYRAQIILAALDTTKRPEYYINGNRIGDDGVYEFTANTLGASSYLGELRVENSDGTIASYPFKSEYSVSEPAATISNTDLNVMYRGYPHKFSISVPGVSSDKLDVKVTGGATISRKGSGVYEIVPGEKAKNVTVSVSANVDGKLRPMGNQDYRILPLPQPGASIRLGEKEFTNTIRYSQITDPKAILVAGYGADALIKLDYTVTSFTVRYRGRQRTSNSSAFTKEQRKLIEDTKKGDDISIVGIKVKTTTGQTLQLERGLVVTID